MNKSIKTFEVTFNEYWSYDRQTGNLNELSVAAKDGESAILKVKTFVLAQKFKDEKNPKVIHKCVGFELLGLEFLSELDL